MAKGLLGIDKVMRKLNREIVKIKGKTIAGLIEASIIIRRDMDLRPPKIPVGDTGNLRASWFTTTGIVISESGGGFKGENAGEMSIDHTKVVTAATGKARGIPHPVLIMGFSANYSGAVHEMVGDINWNRPESGAFFFKSAVSRNHKMVLNVIAKNLKF